VAEDPVDREHLETPGVRTARKRESSNVELRGDDDKVQVIVTQAFGPRGDSLMNEKVRFDGQRSIALLVRANGQEGMVYLSPIHGDPRKSGFTVPNGTKCELICPTSNLPLDRLPDVKSDGGTEYFAIYLTPELSEGAVVGMSNVWGHHHSRVIDHFELISVYLASLEA